MNAIIPILIINIIGGSLSIITYYRHRTLFKKASQERDFVAFLKSSAIFITPFIIILDYFIS